MSNEDLSCEELKERLSRLEAIMSALTKGEVDLLIGLSEPLAVRFRSLIEENERLLEETRQNARDWQSTFDATHSAIWINDIDGRILQANRTAERIFRRSREEFIGKLCWEILHCTREPVPGCPFQKSKESLRSERTEMQLGGRWFEVIVDPVFDQEGRYQKAVHIMNDITDRKETEERLRQSEAEHRRLSKEFQGLLDAIPDGITLIGRDLKIIWANRGAGETIGKTPEALINHHCYTLWHNNEKPCNPCPAIESFTTGKAANHTSTTPDGRIWDLRTVPLRDAKGRVVSIIKVARDITEHRMLESQLLQAQKMESIGRLAGGMAHDFNNMLNAIIGYGEILLNQLRAGDPLREKIEKIVKAGERAASLTRQLLAFSRKQALQPEVLNLNSAILNLKEMLTRLIGEDIELELSLSDNLARVMADPGQIDQVIMNLAVNARDAMPDGGKLRIETANVEVDEQYSEKYAGIAPGRYVMLAVTDTGCGMDEETQKKIFEPFFTTKEKEKGTGLGLSTVYGIVKQSGGDIRVYSEPGKGTTFKIYLPQTDAEPTVETEQAKEEKLRGAREHILVVEDEEIIRTLMKDLLSSLDYEVTVATNGGEAIILVEENGLKPDLLITDVVMPGMNGKALAERLRKTSPDLKVLFMSGYTDNAVVHHDIPAQDTPFIQKPFKISEVAYKVQELLSNERGNPPFME